MKNSDHRHLCSTLTLIETIHGYPSALRIFKIGCSSYWFARVWIHGKFRKASLNTDHKPLVIQRTKYFINDINGLAANHGKCGKVGILILHENTAASEENYFTTSDSQTMK